MYFGKFHKFYSCGYFYILKKNCSVFLEICIQFICTLAQVINLKLTLTKNKLLFYIKRDNSTEIPCSIKFTIHV